MSPDLVQNRPLATFVLLILLLPTVVAADAAQRAAQDDLVHHVGHLRAGEVYTYDLSWSSEIHGTGLSVPAWLTVTVGTAEQRSLVDGRTEQAFPVTWQRAAYPWDEPGPDEPAEGWVERETQWYRATDGAYLERELAWRTYSVAPGEEEPPRIQDRHVVQQDGLGGSAFARGVVPGSTFGGGSLPVQVVLFVLGGTNGHVDRTATIEGRDVFDVGRVYTGTGPPQHFRANLDFPEYSYTDWASEERTEGTTYQIREAQHVWMSSDLGLPVRSEAKSDYVPVHGPGPEEHVSFVLDLVRHEAGTQRLPRDWSAVRSTPSGPDRMATGSSPYAPGVPQDGGSGMTLTIEEAYDLARSSDDLALQALHEKTGGQPGLLRAYYHADRSWYTVADDPRGPVPLPPSLPDVGPDETPTDGRRHIIRSVWSLDLSDHEGTVLNVRVERHVDEHGVVTEETVSVGESGQHDRASVPAELYPQQLITLEQVLRQAGDRGVADVQAWEHGNETGMDVSNLFRLRDGVLVSQDSSASVSHAWGASDNDRRRIETFRFDLADGRLTTMDRMNEQVAAGEGERSFAPAAARAVLVHQHVPAAAAASGFAVFVGAAVLFFGARLRDAAVFAVYTPLFSKIRKDEVLDHKTREAIVELVEASPGVHLEDVRRVLGSGFGTTAHHLRTLERNGLLVSVLEGNKRCWFRPTQQDRESVALLTRPALRKLHEAVLSHPGITQRELAERAGVTPRTVREQVAKLVDAELLTDRKEGRTRRYFPAPAPAST